MKEKKTNIFSFLHFLHILSFKFNVILFARSQINHLFDAYFTFWKYSEQKIMFFFQILNRKLFSGWYLHNNNNIISRKKISTWITLSKTKVNVLVLVPFAGYFKSTVASILLFHPVCFAKYPNNLSPTEIEWISKNL